MGKIFALLIAWIFLPWQSVLAYDLSSRDAQVIQNATWKLEEIIKKKWEPYRQRIIVLLEKAVAKNSGNARLVAIMEKTIRNITPNNPDDDLGDLFGENTSTTSTGVVAIPVVSTVVQQSNAIGKVDSSTGVSLEKADSRSVVKVGQNFRIWNMEYEVLNVDTMPSFNISPTAQWKPKNKEFLIIKLRVNNLDFDAANANRDAIVTNMHIESIGKNSLKLIFTDDMQTRVNVNELEMFKGFSSGSDVSFPWKFYRIFDVWDMERGESYLIIDDTVKVKLFD